LLHSAKIILFIPGQSIYVLSLFNIETSGLSGSTGGGKPTGSNNIILFIVYGIISF
jgi:hypothetical protein